MNNTIKIFIAFIIVYIILKETELYQNIVLDTPWVQTRNKPITTSDPFNMCSPESFSDCKKPEMEHLSRK
jgi:hypothetical protein